MICLGKLNEYGKEVILEKLDNVSATNIAYIKKKKLWKWLTDTLD